MNNANKLCDCGSGKKTKKCHPNRKPRNISITYLFDELKHITEIEVNALTGEAKFYNKDGKIDINSATIDVGYERDTKRKILNQIPLSQNKFTISPHIALVNFDLLLAIDTNTVIVNQKKLSVSCLVKGFVKRKLVRSINKYLEETNLSLLVYPPTNAIAMLNIKEKEENIGWVLFIYYIMHSPFYNENLKIGIITDSDFSNIEDFNKRRLPIYDNLFLPENMEIIHATRDSGSEYFANQLIRLADSEATKWINKFKELAESQTDEFLGLLPVENAPYSHWKRLV